MAFNLHASTLNNVIVIDVCSFKYLTNLILNNKFMWPEVERVYTVGKINTVTTGYEVTECGKKL